MGKTVAADQWGRDVEGVEVLWIPRCTQLCDGTQTELTSHPLIAAIRDALADGAAEAPAPGSPYAQVQQLVQQLSEPTALVIDDYQACTSSELDDALLTLLEMNENLHIVVVARRTATLSSALTLGRVQVRTIGADELAFTADEAVEYAKLRGLPEPEALARLQPTTHGWPIAVRVSTERLLEGADQAGLLSAAAEWVQHQRELIQDPNGWHIAMLVSVCHGVDLPQLAAFAGLTEEETLHAVLELLDLGLIRSKGHSVWAEGQRYTCPDGFRNLIRSRADRELGPKARKLALAHAIALGEREPLEATRQLLELDAYEEAAVLTTRNPSMMLVPDSGLLPLLRAIPQQSLARHASLLGARLLLEAFEGGTNDTVSSLFSGLGAATRDAADDPDPATRQYVLMMLSMVERLDGNTERALRFAQLLEEDLDLALLSAQQPSSETIFARCAIAMTAMLSGEFELAARNANLALQHANERLNIPDQVFALGALALLAALRGEMTKARDHIGTLEQLGEPHPLSTWGTADAARLLLANESDDFETLRIAAAAPPVPDHVNEMWPLYAAAELAVVRAERGNQAAVDRAEELQLESEGYQAHSLRFVREMLTTHLARLAMTVGDYRRAHHHLSRLSLELTPATPAHAQLALLAGEPQKAHDRLERILEARTEPYTQADAKVLLAVAQWQLGKRDQATETLRQAASLMSQHGLTTPLRNAPFHPLREVAVAAAAAGGPDLVPQLDALPPEMRCEQFEELTDAELRTLAAAASNPSLAMAAESMFVTIHTVKFHLRNVYRKLHARGREEAVARAKLMRLLPE